MIKQVLYISYDGMTDPLGQSQVLPYLVGLSKEGYQFTLVSCEKEDRFNKYKDIIKEICSANNIDWRPIFYTKQPPVFSTIWDVFKLVSLAKKLHKTKQFQLIHCRSYIPSLVGLYFKKTYQTKFIFDMRGFWADERVDGKLWNLNNPLFRIVHRFFKRKEKEFLTFSDKTISLTNNGKQEMLSWNIKYLTEDKIAVIPCAADYELFELVTLEKRTQAKKKLGFSDNQFVLSYIGSIGTWYMLDEMLFFFKCLKIKFSDAKFLIITPESENFILNKAKKIGLLQEDFKIMFSERQKLPSLAHASDFSIFFIKPSYSKKSSSPTKMGELMAMGIPLICNNNVGDVEEIVINTNAGFCIDSFTKNSFNQVINELIQPFNTSAEQIRDSSKQFYNLELGLKSYLTVYNQLF